MEVKYHAQFLLDKEKDNPTAKLRYRIKWNGNIVAFNLGYRIEVDKWSKDTQRCKTNTTHGDKKVSANSINRKIQQYELACEKIFQNFSKEGTVVDQNQFRELFNVEIGKKPQVETEKTFFEVFDLFTIEESRINQWTNATDAKMHTLKNHLLNYDSELTFEGLTEQKLFDYQYYLQKKVKFKNSTIIKHFSFLRWFLRWAKKKGYNNNDTESYRKLFD